MALEPDQFEKNPQGEPAKDEFDYDALYYWTSHYVHATVDGIEAHAFAPGQVFKIRARPWVDKPRGKDALLNVAVFLCKIFVIACRTMNEEQPQVLHDTHKLISRFARRKSA